jgi:hypothetical protein
MKTLIPMISNKKENLWDDSRVISTQTIPINQDRHVIIQKWKESGYTFLTYFIPKQGLELLNKDLLIHFLADGGIDLDVKHPSNLDSFSDTNGLECWRLTFTISDSED